MKILSSIVLILLFAGCASYHDGHTKGIFLKNDSSETVVYAGKIYYIIDTTDLEKIKKKGNLIANIVQ
jgi:hypothetical protein